MKRQTGQNLVEFAIIGGLIIVVAIASLSLLGGNISKMFSSSNENMKNFKPYGNNKSPVNNENSPILEGEHFKYDEHGDLTIKLDTLELSGIPGNFAEYIQTAGSSGGTIVLADVISNLALKLEAEGKLPEEEINVLKNMATKAQEMAAVEKKLEELSQGVIDYCNTQPNAQDCSYTDYYTNGGPELVTQLSGDNGHGGLNGEFKSFIKSDDFDNFQQLYPESAIMVQLLQDEISSLAFSININNRSLGDKGHKENGKVRIYNAKDILTPGFEDPSKITDVDGSIICNIGNGSYNPEGCK